METQTEAHRYRGMSVRPRARMRVVPRKEVAFRPCFVWDDGHFLLPFAALRLLMGGYDL